MKISEITVELVDHMGSDLNVVNAARVSFDKKSDWEYEGLNRFRSEYTEKWLSDKDQKLINYLASHGHWSPFAHAFLSVRVKAPIFLARQLVKHQVGLSWNEVSRRYVDSEPEYFLPQTFRSRPENGMKQGSGKAFDNDYAQFSRKFILESTENSHKTYLQLLEEGLAPEQARMVLPQNMMITWVWSGSLMAFARMYNQRSDGHAQLEAQQFAEMLQSVIPKEFEHSWKALTK